MQAPRLARRVLEAPVSKTSNGFVCHSCRHRLLRRLVVPKQQIRRASSNTPFTEKLRRSIWGTDTPPGPKDPYTGPTASEQLAMDRQQQIQPAREIEHDQEDSLALAERQGQKSEAGKEPKEYVPAQTWDGLGRIGNRWHWKSIPPRVIDFHASWAGDLPRRAMNRRELVSCLHASIVMTILQREGVPKMSLFAYYYGLDQELTEAIADATIVLTNDNLTSCLSFSRPELRTNLANTRLDEDSTSEVDDVAITPGTLPAPFANHPDESFLHAMVSLEESLCILQTFTFLSGHRVPDPVLNDMTDNPNAWANLIAYLEKAIQPKAKNLAEVLQTKPELAQASNLKILARRETPVDKEKEVGRWKVIEAELRSRGLPVLGRIASS